MPTGPEYAEGGDFDLLNILAIELMSYPDWDPGIETTHERLYGQTSPGREYTALLRTSVDGLRPEEDIRVSFTLHEPDGNGTTFQYIDEGSDITLWATPEVDGQALAKIFDSYLNGGELSEREMLVFCHLGKLAMSLGDGSLAMPLAQELKVIADHNDGVTLTELIVLAILENTEQPVVVRRWSTNNDCPISLNAGWVIFGGEQSSGPNTPLIEVRLSHPQAYPDGSSYLQFGDGERQLELGSDIDSELLFFSPNNDALDDEEIDTDADASDEDDSSETNCVLKSDITPQINCLMAACISLN